MRKPVLVAATLALLAGVSTTAIASLPSATPPAPAEAPTTPIGLTRLLADAAEGAGSVRGIATFDAVPSETQAAVLRGLGLTVQPLRHLPLALVQGPIGALEAAVATGAALDVYPDEAIELYDEDSSAAMTATSAWDFGLTGTGVTVAVVDSGCDASQPDLADHVVHNVKVVSAEYANVVPDSSNTIAVPIEVGPYQNTDLGSGHGTHVAGIIAADGTADKKQMGVAPDAELVCYSIGEILFTTAVVTAYDHLLDQPDLWGVDVVNNSWGNSFAMFDPRNPVAVATKAVADLGVTVVFAAGNNGDTNAEMSLNPFSASPWVISVAAGTVDHQRAYFSSNGLRFDNSEPVQIGDGGHMEFRGTRIGVYHPDVTAPGYEISSTCNPIGVLVAPCPPGGNAIASGTSMASPHVAGAVAVLKQANPALTPEQVRRALEATATPVNGTHPDEEGNERTEPDFGFWQVGYGYVDLAAAVALVSDPNYSVAIEKAAADADARVLGASAYRVKRSEFWTYDAPRVSVAGVPDTRTFALYIPRQITDMKITLHHPGLGSVAGNFMEYTGTVYDPDGNVLGVTTENVSDGVSSVFIDLKKAGAPTGVMYRVEVSGQRAVSDPDTIDSDSAAGDVVTLQAALLIRH